MKHATVVPLLAVAAVSLLGLVSPCPAADITIPFDMLPGICPNPYSPPALAATPAFFTSIAGTDTLPVIRIDQGSLLLVVPEGGGLRGGGIPAIPPIHTHIQDDITPFIPAVECDCVDDREDGMDDLAAYFDPKALNDALGPRQPGEEVPLCITGRLTDGRTFEGCDCILVISPTSVDEKTWGAVKYLYR